jgi:hypothetical protein
MKRNLIFLITLFTSLALFNSSVKAQGYECEEMLFPKLGPNKQYGYVNLLGEFVVDPVFTQAQPFEGRFAVVMKGSKLGVLNCDGIIIVEPVYEEIGSFLHGSGWARRKDLWEYVDGRGRIVIPASFTEVKDVSPQATLTLVQKDGQWGLFSRESFTMLVKPQFDAIQALSDSASIVRKGNLFGVLSHRNGALTVPVEATQINRLERNLIAFQLKEKWGAIHSKGNLIIPAQYDTLIMQEPRVLLVKEGKYGLADAQGRVILKPLYEQIHPFCQGVAAVRKGGKIGYANIHGRFVIEPQFEEGLCFHKGKAVVKKEGKWGAVSISNKSIVPARYDVLEYSSAHDFFAASANGKTNLLDGNGQPMLKEDLVKVAVEDSAHLVRVWKTSGADYFNTQTREWQTSHDFKRVQPFNNGFALAGTDSQWGVIDGTGKLVVPVANDTVVIHRQPKGPLFAVKQRSFFGLANASGQMLIPAEYSYLEVDKQGTVKVQKGDLYGIMKSNGTWIAEPRFSQLSTLQNAPDAPVWPAVAVRNGKPVLVNSKGDELNKQPASELRWIGEQVFAWENKGKWGLMGANGSMLAPAQFDEVRQFTYGQLAVRQGSRWGFVNKAGRPSVPVNFDEVLDFSGTTTYARQGGKWGAIDQRGNFVLKPEYDRYQVLPDGSRRLLKN